LGRLKLGRIQKKWVSPFYPHGNLCENETFPKFPQTNIEGIPLLEVLKASGNIGISL